MTFTSIADLYFMSVGLLGLNILVNVLIDTGLIYLPFIIVIIEGLFDGFKSSKNMSDTVYSLKTLETRCYAMLIVMVIAFIPVLPYTLEDTVAFQRMCSITGEETEVDIRGYDHNVQGSLIDVSGYDLKVPALINYVFNISHGVTAEAVNRLPCSINITAMNAKFMEKRINDADLLLEVKEFMHQCYQPARSLALQRRDRSMPWIDDPANYHSWPGHPAFMNERYYGNVAKGMYSKTAMDGWHSSPNNENYYAYGNLEESEQASKGYPTCREWWQGVGSGFTGSFTGGPISRGIKARLLDDLSRADDPSEARLLEQMKRIYGDMGKTEDDMINTAFFNPYDVAKIQNFEIKDYAYETEGIASGGLAFLTRAAGTLGNAKIAFENAAGASLIQVAAPIVKSILLFVLLVPFPLALIVSKYSMSFVVQYCFFIFAISFTPFLWDITLLAQQSFIREVFTNEAMALVTNPNIKLIATYTTDAIFMFFPTLFIGILTAAGMKIGGTMASIAGQGAESMGKAGSAGKKGGQEAEGRAKAVGKKVAGKLKK